MKKSDVPMSANGSRARCLIAAIVLILAGAVSGCAHNNPRDPLEPINRRVYIFNDTLDNMVLKPVASGYRQVFPQVVRTGVRNFFSNLDDITVIINGVLQGKMPQAASDTGRFVINTTIGVLGLFDVATHLGLEKHNEDFGQTLGYWGVGSGPYLVLPFLGPSSVRDGIARVADAYTDVVWHVNYIRARNIALGTRVVSQREQLLDSEKILDTAALDPYSFIRDAYLQRRRNLVYDGNPPPEPEEEFLLEEPRSDVLLPAPAVLIDSSGNVVAAPPQGGEPVRAAPSAAKPESDTEPRAPASSSAPPAPQPLQPASSEPSALHAPAASDSSVVRVWLPDGSER